MTNNGTNGSNGAGPAAADAKATFKVKTGLAQMLKGGVRKAICPGPPRLVGRGASLLTPLPRGGALI